MLSSVRQTAPNPEQLAKAKAGLLNSFVFNFASSYSQLQRTLVYQLLGLPQVGRDGFGSWGVNVVEYAVRHSCANSAASHS